MANVWTTANVRPVHMNGRDRRARPLTGTMDRQTVKLPQRSLSEITRQCSCPEIRPRQMQALLCQFASGTRATGHCLVISLIWWWGNVCPSNVPVNGYDRRSRPLNWQVLGCMRPHWRFVAYRQAENCWKHHSRYQDTYQQQCLEICLLQCWTTCWQ